MVFKTDLLQEIKSRGFMPLDEYMQRCNDHYYNEGNPFGTQGDFVTAPEISQIFGELIAAWSVDILGQLGSPNHFSILECGPGRGTLLHDILRTYNYYSMLDRLEGTFLLEASESLRTVQKEKNTGHILTWIEDIHNPDLMTTEGPVFIYGNEFLDALPIRQYVFEKGTWWERGVSVDKNERLIQSTQETNFVPNIASTPKEGDVYETSPAVESFMRHVLQVLKDKGGFALFIDYGYTKTAFGDTFQAVKSHQYADPFENPGEHDLTAHINFDVVGRIAEEEGLHVFGATTQKAFLEKCGLHQRANTLKSTATAEQIKEIESAVYRLSAPKEMGELFKVIAISDKQIIPAGFANEG